MGRSILVSFTAMKLEVRLPVSRSSKIKDLTNFRISLYNRPTTQNGSTCEIGRVTFNVNIYTDQAAASI